MKSYKKNIKSRKAKLSRKTKKIGGSKTIQNLLEEIYILTTKQQYLMEEASSLNQNSNNKKRIVSSFNEIGKKIMKINEDIKILKQRELESSNKNLKSKK